MKSDGTHHDGTGPPLWESDYLHVGRPNLCGADEFLVRARRILERGWLTNRGPEVREFEASLAEYLGVKHCIAMCNGTVALEIAVRAIGLEGEVITTPFTFVATAHSLQWQRIRPVFCDIEPGGYNLDPERVHELVTPRTTGILAVHIWGEPCGTEALQAVADRHGLELMFDAAHAFGCSHGGRMIGSFGRCEVFSFHATKFFHTFEGGAVATNDDALAEKIRLMQNFGFSGMDSVVHVGMNGKMSEISAAMGLAGMENLAHIVEINRRNLALYADALAACSGPALCEYTSTEKRNYQYVVVDVDPDQAGYTRDDLLGFLAERGVRARRYFYPGCHRMEPYRSLYPEVLETCPHADQACSRTLCLPTGTAVSEEDIERICGLIKQCQCDYAGSRSKNL